MRFSITQKFLAVFLLSLALFSAGCKSKKPQQKAADPAAMEDIISSDDNTDIDEEVPMESEEGDENRGE